MPGQRALTIPEEDSNVIGCIVGGSDVEFAVVVEVTNRRLQRALGTIQTLFALWGAKRRVDKRRERQRRIDRDRYQCRREYSSDHANSRSDSTALQLHAPPDSPR